MRAAALLLLGAAALLSGCGNATPQGPLNESQAAAAGKAPDADTAMRERWGKLFADPAAVVAAANDFGYQVPAYGAAGDGFAAKGQQQSIPKTASPILVTTGFEATGKAANAVETVRFTFDVNEKARPESQKQAEALRLPVRIVSGFLNRFEVGPGDEIKRALVEGKSVSTQLHGAMLSVDAQPLPGSKGADSRRLIVRIAKADALAANQQDSTARN